MEFVEKIHRIITRGSGKVVDVFYEFFTLISSLDIDIQPIAFQYMCENVKKHDFDKENPIAIREHFKEGQLEKYWPKLKNKMNDEIKALIFDSSKENVPDEVFYAKVWDLIKSNRICKNKHEKALAIFLLVDNNFIPYKAVGKGISMDEEVYSSIIDSIDPEVVREAEMITQIDYEQKTQKASLLLEKLDTVNTFEERTVFMSMILDMVEERIKNEIKRNLDNM